MTQDQGQHGRPASAAPEAAPSPARRLASLMRWETLAVAAVLVALVGLPVAVFGARAASSFDDVADFTLVASNGRWSPDTIRVQQGEKVRLHLTSHDVVHGFSLPGYDIDVDVVYPGKVTDVEFVADKAGTFPFQCTVWCHVNHPTMRGQLVVE